MRLSIVTAAFLLGAGPLRPSLATESPVIGLWTPARAGETRDSLLATRVRVAARLALEHGRERLGITARLVVAGDEGKWRTASKSLTRLIYEEGATVVIGPLDPAAGHLGLQLATRARVPFLYPAPGDDGLARAGSPWIFSLLPDERAHAEATARLLQLCGQREVQLIVSPGRAKRTARATFGRTLGEVGVELASPRERASAEVGVVVVRLGGAASTQSSGGDSLEKAAERYSSGARILVGGAPPDPGRELPGSYVIPTCVPARDAERDVIDTLRDQLCQAAGESLDPEVLATYDAVTLVLEAIRQVGSDRDKIRAFLSLVRSRGLTGPISFDRAGSRELELAAYRLRDGRWRRLTGTTDRSGSIRR